MANTSMFEATIFALASGAGRSGIAVIRLSGQACSMVCRQMSGGDVPEPRKALLRTFVDPATGEAIDDGLVLWFPGPASFTGEDVLELHVHGGPAVLAAVFEALGSLPGVRPAEAGEFSRRAFLNGKMDLTEAEGLADLVAAESRQQARQAKRQMDGALGRLYGRWREVLIRALAHLEAEIDFAPDEEVPDGLWSDLGSSLEQLRLEIETHLNDGHRGQRLREGLTFALIGPPNAGKSSLINVLSKRDVAIVTDIPGTTRDILEVPLDVHGYPLTVADMAGLRETSDPVEILGVKRARDRADQADFRIVLFDGAVWPDFDQESMKLVNDQTVVLLNKLDLFQEFGEIDIGGCKALGISCLTGEGVSQLLDILASFAEQNLAEGDAPTLTRARHRDALEDVVEALVRIERDAELPELALMAENLRIARDAIGRITGKVSVDDVLDRIFGEFCIGK